MSELQRSRMLASAVAVVSEVGYDGMSVARVTGHAGVSRRTFYDLFEDREDCFVAAFDEVMGQLTRVVIPAYEQGRTWQERVRGALTELLVFFDEHPGARVLVVVDALKAGPRVLERRAVLLEGLSLLLHEGGVSAGAGRELPPLTGEGVVGAVLGVIHSRLLAGSPGPMLELLSSLMGMIVLPYLGPGAAQKELRLPTPRITRTGGSWGVDGVAGNPLSGLAMRVTYRTVLVLTTIGEHPGGSNREIADLAGIADQGQMSKLLGRLVRLGLIVNRGEGQPSGEPNAWQLTSRGREVQHATRTQTGDVNLLVNRTGEPR